MDQPGDNLLADAAFPSNQNRDIGMRDRRRLVVDLFHGRGRGQKEDAVAQLFADDRAAGAARKRAQDAVVDTAYDGLELVL